MKRVDVAIIGAGSAGRSVAHALSANKKDVLLVALPGNPEDYFRKLLSPSSESLVPGNGFKTHVATRLPQFIDKQTFLLDGEETQAAHFVIASGCAPRVPAEFHGRPFTTPLNILTSPESKTKAIILGAGPVGVSTAAKLAKRGSKVTLISNKARILSKEEPEIAAAVQTWLENLGVRIELNSGRAPDGDIILATGLRPHTDGMDLPKAGVYVAPDGRIVVNEDMRTPNNRIHAVGPVTGPFFSLAYEEYQAELAAHNITAPFFNHRKLMAEAIPYIIPTDPPIVHLGLTELEAKKRHRHKGILAVVVSSGDWRIKLVGRKKTTELLGAHLFAPAADAMVLYFDLLMRAAIPLREVTETHHYPSPGISTLAYEAVTAWLNAAGE